MQNTSCASKQGSTSIGPGVNGKWKKTHSVDQEWRYMRITGGPEAKRRLVLPVSYTHLTLPTICSV
eukprot:6180033-Prorocentrum_lima.AAC.1